MIEKEERGFTGKELIYCDPPYLRETRKKHYSIYKYEYSVAQHIELLNVIKSIPCMVMISGYESSLYMESLSNWHAHSFQSTTHHGMATEWIWMNYSPPVQLHDYRYLGDNFREREKLKNKVKRWVAMVLFPQKAFFQLNGFLTAFIISGIVFFVGSYLTQPGKTEKDSLKLFFHPILTK